MPPSAGPILHGDGTTLQLLGLQLLADGREVYEVSFRAAPTAPWHPGQLHFVGEGSWDLTSAGHPSRHLPALGDPDALFARALGEPAPAAARVAAAHPHWPAPIQERLARRRAAGPCTLAFDAAWFLAQLTGSALDHPLLFPDATRRLGLDRLAVATEGLAAACAEHPSVLSLLHHALEGSSPWQGEGRLIGASTWGDLVQAGSDIAEGLCAAEGSGPLRVRFDPDEPMGLGFAPQLPSADVLAGRPAQGEASVGAGVEVGEVDPDSAAEAAGVRPGMVVTHLGSRSLREGGVPLPFEDILEALDLERDAGAWVELVFATAAPLDRWYAVELPAASALAALGASVPDDAGVGASFDALCGEALLWREPIPRLFVGAPGSVTCAHIDICPQVQLAHGLVGTKVLGVASHPATPRLVAEHGGAGDTGAIDDGATHVPTDRPLSARQADLLDDPDLSLVWLGAGDLAVLHSGALHFASNGAEGLAASLYHGVITPAALPRLREAAAAGGAAAGSDDPYAQHLVAADLLRLVEALGV